MAGYLDLAVYDSDPVALMRRALDDVTSKFPGWRPLEGDLPVVLLEQFALMVAESVYAANRAPAIVMESLLGLYGLTQDAGAAPEADFLFTVATTGGERTVPAGTRVLVKGDTEDDAQVFSTTATLTIPAGATTGVIAATAAERTSSLNGATGLAVQALDSVAYVESVTLSGVVRNGRDPEDVQAYLDRGALMLSRLTSTLVRVDQFAAAAMSDPDVARAIALDLYDPGQSPPEGRAGHVTLAVLGQNGAALTPEKKAALEAALEAQAVAILDVHVVDATVTPVDVTVDVVARPGWLPADVKASIQHTMDTYLDPAEWSFGDQVFVNELISAVDQTEGVERVIAVEAPAADVTLPGVGPVASLGTLVVKVDGVVVP